MDYWVWAYVARSLGTVAQLCGGIYLLFFGERLIRRCLQDTIGRCPLCQYDLKGRAGDCCPECGWALPKPEAAQTPGVRGSPVS
jgi:predicted amidophosphoribosyltransferase